MTNHRTIQPHARKVIVGVDTHKHVHVAVAIDTWTPTYADMGATREVVLHIHHPIGGEEIYRATDTYPAGNYDGKTETTVLCTGDRGVVY